MSGFLRKFGKTMEISETMKQSAFVRDIKEARKDGGSVLVYGAEGAAKACLASALFSARPTVLLVPDRKAAILWEEDLRFFAPELPIFSFPVVEYADFSVTHMGTEALRGRMEALAALLMKKPCIVLATAVEAAQKITAPSVLEDRALRWETGAVVDRDACIRELVRRGYERVESVERAGHIAVRGDIVDIFAMNEVEPYRLEFFDNEIESIRSFDVDSQRSTAVLTEVFILPAAAETGEASLLAYAKDAFFIADEPQHIENEIRKFIKEEKENRNRIFSWTELVGNIKSAFLFSTLHRPFPEFSVTAAFAWEGEAATNYRRQFSLFADEAKLRLSDGWTFSIAVANEFEKEKIARHLQADGIRISETETPGAVSFLPGIISKGFSWRPERRVLLAAGDLLGQSKIRRESGKKGSGKPLRFFYELSEGDYVVQKTHGIGRYLGLKTMEVDGTHRDYLTIQYAEGDKLYLPMEQISSLEKYIGAEGAVPTLSKMGGVQWDKVKSRAKKSIEEMAGQLLQIYAKREITKGIAFAPDTKEQIEFEDAFPYVETEDQLRAVAKIKAAMERPEPMEMLLCGDVGFGKTEVAMRAVFKCVMSGYQAMVLAPTTVLTVQHFQTFSERMEHFGVTVRCLNRFASAKEKQNILNDFALGNVDVLIGTHAILSKQIESRHLGLLVVDEEQRFGVAQKEKWKSRQAGIDVLTLSATPIPRTLHMSLAGLRDMATLTEPPANRHAIQTYVTEYDDTVVKEAILREKERGGQVYFIFNRIQTIEAMADHLRTLLPPEVTIGVAHGRMTGDALERVVYDFFRGEYDVLLCTTIVENGIDQPNANTMIVYDADRMGLSQLYQMRGRVGRSDKIARAYFFYRRGKMLTETAEKRLNTIREFTDLGAGFKIAMRDLEIRGAGNLLGSAQHGNIAAVGFATYCTMLDTAVKKLQREQKGEPPPRALPDTRIEFSDDAYIDDAYSKRSEVKIELYRRLAALDTEEELSDLEKEMEDRFGKPTAPVKRLLAVARLRVLAKQLGIGSIGTEEDHWLITWADETPLSHFDPTKLSAEYWENIHFLPQAPLRVTIKKSATGKNPIPWLTGFLEAVKRGATV